MQFTATEDDSTPDERTIHVGNLVPEKISEALLYELFLQGGPLARVSIPKEKDGSNRAYGFITYRHLVSVAYALSVFSGTRLHNRELRLNYRQANRSNADNSTNTAGPSRVDETRSQAMCPQPLMSMMPPQHQFQMQNTIDTSALNARAASALSNPVPMTAGNPFSNSMTPRKGQSSGGGGGGGGGGGAANQFQQSIDVNQLLALSAQMMQPMADQGDMHNHQSKMMHRDDSRMHGRNNNYSRDREQRRDDRKRDRSRERSDWVRNQCQNFGNDRNDNDRNGRHGRGNRNSGGGRNSDNRFRSDDRRRF